MYRASVLSVFGLAVFLTALAAQDRPQQATVKKVDADKRTITLTVDGKDRDFVIADETRFMGASGQILKDPLKSSELKEGTRVMFKTRSQEGKTVLLGLRLVRDAEPPAEARIGKVDTAKLKPLTEMGTEQYQGFPGGLYADGKNERPAAHEAAGLALAKQVRPLDADGKPSPDGKIVLLSVGMSNTTQEFSVFKKLADADAEKNANLVIVDGAQGGMTAARTKDPEDNGSGTKFWGTVDQRLEKAGVTRAQVQVAWIKQADAGPKQGFPSYAKTLQEEMAQIARLMHTRFPNLKLVYLSSRIYGGYAKTPLNPEPYAYESGFSVKWLIEQQLKGDPTLNFDARKGPVKAPWLSWGPYLWANGTTKRADGLIYVAGDLGGDGTHPSDTGRQKVAEQLLRFLKNDSTAKSWFLRG